MRQFVTGMVCGAAVLYGAMHYHFVHGQDGITLVPKISNNLSHVYVDIREFDLTDWQQHKPLAAAIMHSNQSHLLEDSSLTSFRESMRSLVDGIFKT